MTTFLFCAVAVSGMAILNRVPFNRRTRFILTASLAVGYGATLVPDWFSYVFTYSGGNHSLRGFLDAIELVMETGFAVTALVAMLLDLALQEEIEDTVSVVEVEDRGDGNEEGASSSSSKGQSEVPKVLEV
jgi:xanthine/uracil permease